MNQCMLIIYNYTILYLLCINILISLIILYYTYYVSIFWYHMGSHMINIYFLYISMICTFSLLAFSGGEFVCQPGLQFFARPLPRAEGKRCGVTLSSLGEELSPAFGVPWWWGFNIFQTGERSMVHGTHPYLCMNIKVNKLWY